MLQKYKETILYIVFFVIVIAWLCTRIVPAIGNFFTVTNDIKTKTVEAADLERKIETLKASALKNETQNSNTTKKIYKPDEAGIEMEASFATMFDDLIEIARFNSIKTKAIEYTYNPPEDAFVKGAGEKYNVCQLDMQLIGDYTDFENFMKDLYKYPYLINISKLEIAPYEKNRSILLINFQVRLYSQK